MRYLHRRRNPSVFGEDLATVGWGVVGASGAAALDDKVIAPILDAIFPQLGQNHTIRKAIDGLTTMAAAVGVGELVSMVSASAAKAAQFGGAMIGGSRIITAFVPGWALSSTVPINLPDVTKFLGLTPGGDARHDALPAGAALESAAIVSPAPTNPYLPSVPPSVPPGSTIYASVVPSNAFAANRVTGL